MTDTQTTATDTGLPTLPAAAELIETQVDKQAFFQTLSQHGIVPENEQEARTLYDLGYELHAKTAEAVAADNRFKTAAANVLQTTPARQQTAGEAVQSKEAALVLMQNPAIYAATIALLQTHEAE
jgi:hypothetical protein